jgi:hypothetical protein
LLGTRSCIRNERACLSALTPTLCLHTLHMGTAMNFASPFSDLGKILLVIGIALVAVGALLLFGLKLPFRLGRLPGDIVYQGRHGSFYFPITTCIVLSLALTLLMWIINFFRR